MTVREMQEGVEILIRQIDKNLPNRLMSTDIEYYLTAAQNEIVSRRFSGHNLVGEAFEETVKRMEDLRLLNRIEKDIALDGVNNPSNISNAVYFSALPSDYMFYVKSFSTVTRTDTTPTGFNTANKLIKSEDSSKYIATPYNNPILREPVAILIGSATGDAVDNGILILHDSFTTIVTLDVQYLRKPLKLTSEALAGVYASGYVNTSELPEYLHQEIVTTSVRMITATENPEKYQVKSLEDDKSE